MDGRDSWYARSTGPVAAAPPLAGGIDTETCIVGGGMAGLATALGLAERGRPAVLLEAGRIGDGASGRNGGMVSAGFTRDHAFIAARAGAAAAEALYRLSRDAVATLRARVERWRIACEPVDGVLEASWFSDAAALQADAAAANRLGARLEAWPGERVRDLYRSQRYRGGLFDPDGFHLDPLRLCRGLAAAATALGVRLFEASSATAVSPAGGRWRVATADGTVTADRVVLATNVPLPVLAPQPRDGLVPIHTFIVVTEPRPERLAEAVRAPHAVYDDRFATGYYRPLAEGRLLWGGRIDAFGPPRDLERLMRRDLALVFPQLADLPFAAAWSGVMGFTRHRMPVVRPLAEGCWVATGFGGHGLNTTVLAGELVAAALAEGDDRWRLLAPFDLARTGGPLGRLAAQAVYLAYRARDRLRLLRQA